MPSGSLDSKAILSNRTFGGDRNVLCLCCPSEQPLPHVAIEYLKCASTNKELTLNFYLILINLHLNGPMWLAVTILYRIVLGQGYLSELAVVMKCSASVLSRREGSH